MRVVASVKVGSRGRIYVPEEVREALHVDEGDYLVIREEIVTEKGKERKRLSVEKLV